MKILETLGVGILVLSIGNQALAQSTPNRPSKGSKYRTLFTLAGGGGGFALGFLVGFSAFDDSIHSDRKLWTTAALSGAGGAVGGYFLGRSLDRRQATMNTTRQADRFYETLMRSPSEVRMDSHDRRMQNPPVQTLLAVTSLPSSAHISMEYPYPSEVYLRSALQQIREMP